MHLLGHGHLAPLAALLGLFVSGCSSGDAAPTEPSAGEARGLDAEIIADELGTRATVHVLDAHARPILLAEGEILHVTIAGEDRVLVRGNDALGDPVYEARLPATAYTADALVMLHEQGGRDVAVTGALRLSRPFTIASAPGEVTFGRDLRLQFVRSDQPAAGKATISFEGACIEPVRDAHLPLSGNLDDARFETSLLVLRGSSGCLLDAVVRVVGEGYPSGPMRRGPSPTPVAVRQRSFRVQLVP